MKKFLLALLLAFPMAKGNAEPVEVLSEGGVAVSFEKTGDADQIDAFKKGILPEVKKILQDLTSDLGVSAGDKHVKVFFYSPETYAKKFPHTINRQIPAFYSGEGVQARADNEVTEAMKSTLRHELTHLILDRNFTRIPAWLNEGLAVYEGRLITVDPMPHNIDYNTLHIAKQDGKFIPLEKLEGQGTFGRDHGTVAAGLAYTTAYVAVYELKQKFGMDGIRRYLEGVKKGKDPHQEFESVFDMSVEKFDTQLLKAAAEKS